MKTRKTRAGEAVPVPQSQDQANAALARIGAIQRELAVVQAGLDELVANAKRAAENQAQPLKAELEATTRGLQVWAEANRAALTQDGRRKSAELPAGTLGWRARPPSVAVANMKAAVGFVVAGGAALAAFLRTKHELNKEAMLAAPDAAAGIPGVRIGSPGEEFFVEPTGTPLAPAAAA